MLFQTGPDASLNTLALKLSGIDREFKVTDGGSGFAEKDARTGEPTGILRNCTRYVKVKPATRAASRAEHLQRLRELFADYNSVGLTSICDRDASIDEIALHQELRARGELTVRVSVSQHIDSIGPLTNILASIRQVQSYPADIAFVRDLRRIYFHHHRKTDRLGRSLCGLARGGEPAKRDRQAERMQ